MVLTNMSNKIEFQSTLPARGATVSAIAIISA